MQIVIEILLFTAIICLGVGLFFLFKRTSKTQNLLDSLFDETGKGDFGQRFDEQIKRIKEAQNKSVEATKNLNKFIEESRGNIQKLALKRFNPFSETGGDQSFVLVLMDKDNNGVILSSLHQREVTRVYAKEVKGGHSSHKLSTEEAMTLKEAINS